MDYAQRNGKVLWNGLYVDFFWGGRLVENIKSLKMNVCKLIFEILRTNCITTQD